MTEFLIWIVVLCLSLSHTLTHICILYISTAFTLRPVKCRVRDEAPNLGSRVWQCVAGQGCFTPRGAVVDEYGAMVGWWFVVVNQRSRRKTCSSAASSTTNLSSGHPWLNPGLHCEKSASDSRPSRTHTHIFIYFIHVSTFSKPGPYMLNQEDAFRFWKCMPI
jgi:hypothetical protein